MSGGDGTVINSQVHVARRTWEPLVTPCLFRHLMIVLTDDVVFWVSGPRLEAP
jgi:hypothetical protein